MSRRLRAGAVLAAALAGPGCPGRPKAVVYDLAVRVPVAETWSGDDVLRFGTPAAEPRLTDGFHREGGGSDEPFLWSKGEAEVAFQWDAPLARVAILDAAPYRGVRDQAVEVRLNGALVERFRLNDVRHRYRIGLPAAAQKPGDNRLRFVFAATASPADADPKSLDKRQLAAAFYTLVTGPAADVSLEDLLGRDAPRPFAVGDEKGVPGLTLLGPAVVRFALKLPPSAELRFTPELLPLARAAAGAASFRVTVESLTGGEQEVWSRVLDARAKAPGEQAVRLPGNAGDIVRIGLAVGEAASPRFAWGRFVAPRVLGSGGSDPLRPLPVSPADDARGRRPAPGPGRVPTSSSSSSTPAGRSRSGPTATARPTTPEIDRIAAEGVVFERAYTPAVYTLGAMSSLWTSQYPDRHHSEVSFSARLPKDRLTLAELLSAQGIHTAGFVANAVAGKGFGFDRGLRGVPRGLPHPGEPGRRLPQGPAALVEAEPRPALLRLPALPRAALPVRPRAALRHEVRAGRADPEGGAAGRRVLHRRQPGPPALQRSGARAPRAPLRREPRLRGPGGGGAAKGAGGRGPLGQDRRHRGRGPRRGALRATAGSATTSTSTSRA